MTAARKSSKEEALDRSLASELARLRSQRSKPRRSGLAVLPLNDNRAQKQSNLPSVERVVSEIPPSLLGTLKELVSGNSPWPLFLSGPAGVGKTCAALCLLDLAGGEYHTVSGLCDLLIRAQQGRLEWHYQGRGGIVWPERLWAAIAAAPLVVLDEIGTREKVSDAHYEAVRTAIDKRHGRPFVAISNFDLSHLARLYDDRVFSRLAAGTVVELDGADRRLTGV